MKLDVKIQLLNFCFQVLNFIFLALGLSVFGVGFWILFDRGSLLTVLPTDELRTVGAGLMLIGLVVSAVCVLGTLGAYRETRVLLLLYLVFLVVLVLGQLFVTLLLLISRGKVEESVAHSVDQILLQYGEQRCEDTLMDRIQNHEGCCGRTGPSDWLKNSYLQSLNLTNPDVLPCSCFRSYRRGDGSPWCSELLNVTEPLTSPGNSSYTEGCQEKVSDWLHENILTIVGMLVALMSIQVLQFVITVYLYRTFGTRDALKDNDLLTDSEDDPDDGERSCGHTGPDEGYTDPAYLDHHHDYPTPADPAYLDHHHDYPTPADPAYLDHHHDYPTPADPAYLDHHHDYPTPADPAYLDHHHDNQNYH